MISFKLEQFEGPLDLLLHLISKHKMNIYDVEISKLLEQYLLYMERMEQTDFESAGDFLAMAARLIYIKTAALLPKPNDADEVKKELEGILIEYSLCRIAAKNLTDLYCGNMIYVRVPLKLEKDVTYKRPHSVMELLRAYAGIGASSAMNEEETYKKRFEPIVSGKMVSVTSKVVSILRKLYTVGRADMSKLYDGINDRSERVATFLAVLELTKSGRIRITDDNSEIVFWSKTHNRRRKEIIQKV